MPQVMIHGNMPITQGLQQFPDIMSGSNQMGQSPYHMNKSQSQQINHRQN
jgi:hypothetical protein